MKCLQKLGWRLNPHLWHSMQMDLFCYIITKDNKLKHNITQKNIINAIVLFHYREGFQSQKKHTTTAPPMSSLNIVASQLQNIADYYCITNNSFPSRKGFGWGGYWMNPFHSLLNRMKPKTPSYWMDPIHSLSVQNPLPKFPFHYQKILCIDHIHNGVHK
jgi:hypothetical protein